MSVFHFPSNLFSFDNRGLEAVEFKKYIDKRISWRSNTDLRTELCPQDGRCHGSLYRIRNLHSPGTLITYFPCSSNYLFFIINFRTAEPQTLSWFTPPESIFLLVRVFILKLWPFVFEYFVSILVKTGLSYIYSSSLNSLNDNFGMCFFAEENESYGFSHTYCSLRTPNGNLTIYMGFL